MRGILECLSCCMISTFQDHILTYIYPGDPKPTWETADGLKRLLPEVVCLAEFW